MEEYKPFRPQIFSVSACVPQISPKRRHFKEQQEQLGEFTAPTFFYVSLPPAREPLPVFPVICGCNVCALLHTTFKRFYKYLKAKAHICWWVANAGVTW